MMLFGKHRVRSLIEKIYVSTDCPTIRETAVSYGCEIIDRPLELQDPDTLTEDVLTHSHKVIENKEGDIDFYVLLYANGGFVNSTLIDDAISKLN